MSGEKCKYCGGEIGYIGMPYGFTCLNRNCITHNDKEFIQELKQQLKAAKEENEYRDNMLCEQIEIWRSNCDVWMNQSNKFEQQNKQMRVALENVKFEAEFNGNDESLQKIINIVDNTLKGVE